jgi:hypothetical protein
MRMNTMTRRRIAAALLALLSLVAACGGDSDPTTTGEAGASAATTATTGSGEATGETADPVFPDVSTAKFSDPTTIDNEWFPLTPGHRLVQEGETVEDGETFEHRLEYVVTEMTKEIAGVETRVVWIEDHSDGELVEAEVAFYAQDDDGNVWFFGEYPEEYEDGKMIDAPTWIAGLAEAKAGIAMHAEPSPELTPYFQGWGPAVDWSDYGVIRELSSEELCVPLACYPESLVIAESSLDEKGIFQLKTYAKGVGNVDVDFTGPDKTQEKLQAISFGPLSPAELEEYQDKALALEQSANEVSPGLYGKTAPMR